MSVLLDTCVILWAVGDPSKLSGTAETALEDPGHTRYVSVVSCMEIACLHRQHRIRLDRPWHRWFDHFVAINNWRVLDVDLSVAREGWLLPGRFHGDPGDRLLVATARLHGVPILTSDREILDYPHVPSLW